MNGNAFKIVRLVVLALSVIITIIALFVALQYFAAHQLVGGFIDQVQEVVGVSRFLASAIAALLFIPAVIGVKWSFHLFSRRKRLIGMSLIVLFIVLFNGALWLSTKDQFFTRTGKPLKCYVITRDGVTFRDQAGTDPATGRPCRWVTAAVLPKVKLLHEKLKSGRKIVPFVPTASTPFFAATTGEPIVWHTRRQSGAYDFFDTPGFHPQTGDELQPVTKAVIKDWQEWKAEAKRKQLEKMQRLRREAQRRAELKAKEAKRQAALKADEARRQVAAKKREAERIKREEALRRRLAREEQARRERIEREKEEARRKEEERRRRLVHLQVMRSLVIPPATGTGQKIVALAVVGQGSGGAGLRDLFLEAINKKKSKAGFSANYFRQGFFKSGYFDKVFDGNLQPLQEAEAFRYASSIGLAKVGATCRPNPIAKEITNCEISLQYRIYRFDGKLVKSGRVSSKGPGVDRRQALVRGVQLLIDGHVHRLLKVTQEQQQ